ncbi:MAG: diguanylate cyclase [Negativicutes bacterium]|nr:diguanylate cyclase [Negativicutes bacterium]
MSAARRTNRRSEQESKLNAALAALSSAIISPTTSFDEMYRLVLENARALTKSQHGFVSSVDQQTRAHVSNTLTKMRDEGCSVQASFYALPDEPHKMYGSLWGHSLNRREAFFTNSPASHPAANGLPAGHLPLKNFLSVPVMFGEAVLGQIALANSPRDYSKEDLDMISRLGELYAVVLHNRQREDELRRSEERFRLMAEAAPFPMVVAKTADHAIVYMNPRAMELFGFSREGVMGSNILDYYLRPEQRLAIITEVQQHGRTLDREVKLRDAQGKPFWALLSAAQVDWFGEEVTMTAINEITDRKRMEEELTRLATVDYLTGLWNRRYFMELGSLEHERHVRYKRPLSIIIFDLDHFKKVNDTFGHQTGDRVLDGTAKTVLAELRLVDVAGRYGGEEFAVILPETACGEAVKVAERLRQAIAAHRYSVKDSGELSVTASFGICQAVDSDRSFEDIITRADNALYKAKAMGRNQLYSC